LNESRRFNVLRAGSRFGKSTLARHIVMGEALRGRPACWVASSYKFLLPSWREVTELLGAAIISTSQEEKRVVMGGGSIDFWSADAGAPAGEGRSYSVVVIDECAQLGADLERLWTRSLRPTLADLAPSSSAWFLSTSKAASSYFSTIFAYGQGEREDWKSWQLGTADNPYIPASELDAALMPSCPPLMIIGGTSAGAGRSSDLRYDCISVTRHL